MSIEYVRKYLEKLASGTILYVINDDGFMAGNGCRFVRIDEAAPDMAEVIIKGKKVPISIGRLTNDLTPNPFIDEGANDD